MEKGPVRARSYNSWQRRNAKRIVMKEDSRGGCKLSPFFGLVPRRRRGERVVEGVVMKVRPTTTRDGLMAAQLGASTSKRGGEIWARLLAYGGEGRSA